MLLPYKSRLRKKSVFFARTGRSVIQFYNKLAAVYWLPMFWPRRRPGTHGTHFVSMSGPTVHPYTVSISCSIFLIPRVTLLIYSNLASKLPITLSCLAEIQKLGNRNSGCFLFVSGNTSFVYVVSVSHKPSTSSNVVSILKIEQDACTGVHSACRREENGHNLDICVLRRLRPRQGQMQGFLGLKVGGGS